jgi:hypothetical protein
MLIIPTCQHSDIDLVRTGEKVEDEKDRLLERVCPPPPLPACWLRPPRTLVHPNVVASSSYVNYCFVLYT